MTIVVALILSLLFTGLKGIHDKNEAIYNKKAIISAIQNKLDAPVASMSPDQVQNIFNENIEQHVYDMKGNELSKEDVEALGYKGGMAENVNMANEKKKPEADRVIPMYVYNNNGEKLYIVSVRGNGLWDEIWGNIALEKDFATIAGVDFDHKGETPGLGAEIKDNTAWKKQFIGKKIYDKSGDYTSVEIIKGGVKSPSQYKIDGISGATITANGVAEMLHRGLAYYQPVFEKIKN